MLGKDSVLGRITTRARHREAPASLSLFENTTAAVEAQLSRTPLDGPWLQVVLRDQLDVTTPANAILKQGKKPLAMLTGELLLVSRAAPRCVRVPLIRQARARVFDYQELPEQELVKLASG